MLVVPGWVLLAGGLPDAAMSACCRVSRMERDARDSVGRCAALEQEFPWIAGEKQLFGCASHPRTPCKLHRSKHMIIVIIREATRSL